jgi:hypothetical protein
MAGTILWPALAPGDHLGTLALFERDFRLGTLETGRCGPAEGPPRGSRASIGWIVRTSGSGGAGWQPATGSAPVADQSGTSPRLIQLSAIQPVSAAHSHGDHGERAGILSTIPLNRRHA